MPSKLLLALAVTGLALVAGPVVGTAQADICQIDDTKCLVRKARECYVPDPTDPGPRVCTDGVPVDPS